MKIKESIKDNIVNFFLEANTFIKSAFNNSKKK